MARRTPRRTGRGSRQIAPGAKLIENVSGVGAGYVGHCAAAATTDHFLAVDADTWRSTASASSCRSRRHRPRPCSGMRATRSTGLEYGHGAVKLFPTAAAEGQPAALEKASISARRSAASATPRSAPRSTASMPMPSRPGPAPSGNAPSSRSAPRSATNRPGRWRSCASMPGAAAPQGRGFRRLVPERRRRWPRLRLCPGGERWACQDQRLRLASVDLPRAPRPQDHDADPSRTKGRRIRRCFPPTARTSLT